MTIIDSIESGLQEAAKLRGDLFKAISDALEQINRGDLESEQVPNGNSSINGIQARLTGFCSIGEQVTSDSYDAHLVSLDYLKKFKNTVQAINNAQSEILNNCTSSGYFGHRA